MSRVHNIVRKAIRENKLHRPDRCELCGFSPIDEYRGDLSEEGAKDWLLAKHINGHHDDYSRPLDIKWLCKSCHKKLHTVVS
jgi:hypothetical protein